MYMYVFAFFALIVLAYIINKIISYAKLVHYSSAKNLDYGYLVSHDKEGVREKRLTKETIEMISSAISMPLDSELYLKNGFTNFTLPYSIKNVKNPAVFIKLIDYNGKEFYQVNRKRQSSCDEKSIPEAIRAWISSSVITSAISSTSTLK